MGLSWLLSRKVVGTWGCVVGMVQGARAAYDNVRISMGYGDSDVHTPMRVGD